MLSLKNSGKAPKAGNINEDLDKMEQRILSFLNEEGVKRETLESYDPFRFKSSSMKMNSFALGAPKIGSSL